MNQLTAAGLDGQTLQSLIREKSIETGAFTVQELIDLKLKAGLSNKTIQLLIAEGSFIKNREPVVYGQDIKSLRVTGIQDIIALKQAGISDEVIQSIIISGSNKQDQHDRENAWEMLKNMGFVIDTRQKNDETIH
jgi:hypothetical protein